MAAVKAVAALAAVVEAAALVAAAAAAVDLAAAAVAAVVEARDAKSARHRLIPKAMNSPRKLFSSTVAPRS